MPSSASPKVTKNKKWNERIGRLQKFRRGHRKIHLFLDSPVFPFWKKVPENMPGLPENSFILNASLIKGHELRTTTVFVPRNMLNISPYFFPSFLQLLPTFFTSINGICPTRGKPTGPWIQKFDLLKLKGLIFFSILIVLLQYLLGREVR